MYPRDTRDVGLSGLSSNPRKGNTIGRLRAIRVYLIFVYAVRIQRTHIDRLDARLWYGVFRMLDNIIAWPDVSRPSMGESKG